jgi:hypothetical protein
MAKYNSIALGTASGKLGNLIFQAYNKMKIVRSKNTTTTNLEAPARLSVKRKMKNTSTIWGVFNVYFSYMKFGKKWNESSYNYFFRKFNLIMIDFLGANLIDIFNSIKNYSRSDVSSFFIGISQRIMSPEGFYQYNTQVYPNFTFYRDDYRVRALLLDANINVSAILDIPYSEFFFNNKQVIFETDLSADYVNMSFFIYSTSGSSGSDICFYNPEILL